MFTYGGSKHVTLTRDCMKCVIDILPEEYWYNFKLNKKLYNLLKQSYKGGTTKELAKNGHIESLNGRVVKLKHVLCPAQ